MTAPLFGLVLAGGRRTRMGRDKAGLQFEGRTQLARAFGLLSGCMRRDFERARTGAAHELDRGVACTRRGWGAEWGCGHETSLCS